MSELLFQNTLITWVGSPLISILVSVFLVMVIWTMIAIRDKKKSYIEPPIIREYIPSREDDPHYIEQTLAHIREYIEDRSSPHHTTAHTAPEISEYLRDTDLLIIIGELEHSEYSGGMLSIEEKKNYNERIQKLVG
jgi:phosphate/sulfate permease